MLCDPAVLLLCMHRGHHDAPNISNAATIIHHVLPRVTHTPYSACRTRKLVQQPFGCGHHTAQCAGWDDSISRLSVLVIAAMSEHQIISMLPYEIVLVTE